MFRFIRKNILHAMCLAALASLGGCAAYEPFEYHAPADMKPGAGFFSGEDGDFVYQRTVGKRE